MSPEIRDKKIVEWSRKIHETLTQTLPRNLSEADFRRVIDPLLDRFCEEIGATPLAHSEYTLATGRADAVFNRLVVEYERPGTLRKTLHDSATNHAVQQVKNYLQGVSQKERREIDRLAGVVFDGYVLVFVRKLGGGWVVEQPVEVSEHSLKRFLTWLAGLSSGVALTSENLSRDFTVEQEHTQNILRGLFHGLNTALQSQNSLVLGLFEQWRLFFGEAIGYSETFGGGKLEPLKEWVAKAGILMEDAKGAERFFFVLHTYFALLLKLLAWQALWRHLGMKVGGASFAGLATAQGEILRQDLREMESGGIFRKFGIMNLLEGDFFSWYLHAWDQRVEEALRQMIAILDQYDPTTISVMPEETRDLFKKLYHYLLPKKVRHNLGEYYTPDWLSQRLLNQMDNDFFLNWRKRNEALMRKRLLSLRFLDPACGSGTFLILVIAHMLEMGRALMVQETELLESILHNVVGFDLNPLAVLTARVNYVLAIADLLQYRRKEVNIPVYLADSVRTPSLGNELQTQDAYEFPTAVGTFLVPAIFCTPERFDRLCNILEDSLQSHLDTDAFIRRVTNDLALDGITSSKWRWNEGAVALTTALYEKMRDLHRQGLNGLWARLLKNNFAPLTVGLFDYIIGNPPWVNWESLPDNYRREIKPIWERFGLFPHGGMDTILGKGKKDISMLMTFCVMHALLRIHGKLGFVITQSVFKTSGAAQGFRRLEIPEGEGKTMPLRVVYVDDMASLNPFEGASNRTAIMVIEKGRQTSFPVPYTVWRKVKGARFTYNSTLDEVLSATKRLEFHAEPVDPNDKTSPWLTARPKALQAIRKVLGKSDYVAHAGANSGGANAVYWLELVHERPDGLVVVRNIVEGAKIQVKEVIEALEPDLLFPLLRGRDVKRWSAKPSAWILITQDPKKRRGIDTKEMQMRYPRTYGYLKRFEDVLRKRAAFKRYFTRLERRRKVVETGPFYSMFNIGDYTFAKWKVVWREQARTLIASVVSTMAQRPIIPDHKLMLIPCQTKKEAHFVSACLNSSPSQLAALCYAIQIQMDPHILEHIRIPSFDPKNPVHQKLSELSEIAHKLAQEDNAQELAKIEKEIDLEARKVWGITKAELSEIVLSLEELQDDPEEADGDDE